MNIPKFDISLFQDNDKFLKISNDLNNKLNNSNIDNFQIFEENYYSDQNINNIQLTLIKKVYDNHKYIIPYQKNEHIKQIMLGIYKDHSLFLPYDFKEQLDRLNNIVVDFCYPFVIKEIKSQLIYLDDINKPRNLVSLPENASIAGRRTLPSMFLPLAP